MKKISDVKHLSKHCFVLILLVCCVYSNSIFGGGCFEAIQEQFSDANVFTANMKESEVTAADARQAINKLKKELNGVSDGEKDKIQEYIEALVTYVTDLHPAEPPATDPISLKDRLTDIFGESVGGELVENDYSSLRSVEIIDSILKNLTESDQSTLSSEDKQSLDTMIRDISLKHSALIFMTGLETESCFR